MSLRVLITGARAPAALHLARLLDGAGHTVFAADSLRWPITASTRACRQYIRLPPANGDIQAYGAAVREAVLAHKIDLVIPTCEEVFYLSAQWGNVDVSAQLFAPSIRLLKSAHNKFSFVELASSLGLAVPETRLLLSQDDMRALQLPAQSLVFKPVWSRFATEVLVQPKTPLIAPTVTKPWIAQEFIEGQELCAYAVARHGKLIGLSCYQPTYRAGKGAGVAFEPVIDQDIHDYVCCFIEGTSWHGQVSFDFIKQSDGKVVAIECNPRATSGIHFFDAPTSFANALTSGTVCTPKVTQTLGVKAAVMLYGPSQKFWGFWKDAGKIVDVIAQPDDPQPARRQLLATLEMAVIALRNRISLTQATTHDIAWNGD